MSLGKKVKGITIEFNGDTTKLGKAINDVEKKTKSVDDELKSVNRALKFNPGSVELWTQKQQLLTQKVGETKQKLDILKQAQEQMDGNDVDKNSQEYRELQREIIETESKLKHFEKQLKDVGNVKLTALGNELKQTGDKMKNVGKGATTYVSAPIAAGFGAAVKTTMDFDGAMSQVAATMGKTTKDMESEQVSVDGFTGSLRDLAVEMGSKTAFSATEAAEALNYMALAGYDAQTSADMLPKVLNLAAAGNMDLATASDMVTDSQSALGLSLDETETLIDQMARTSSKSNTSVEQLGSAILTVGGTAKTMKGGTEELNSVLGVLADNGVKGAEGGTALRNILLSLGSPTDKAAKQLEALGVSVYDSEGKMKDLRDLMPELNGALSQLTDEERTQAIASIFNKRDLKSVNALLSTSTDRWDELSGAISDSGGAAEQMADTQLDNLGGSLTILKSALEGLAINVGDVLTPYIKKLAEWITSLVDKFNGLSPTVQTVIVAIAGIAAAIGPLLVITGVMISSIGQLLIAGPKIVSMFGAVGKAFGALKGILMANPWVLIAAAAIAAIILIVKNWDKIKEFFSNLWNGIKNVALAAWNGIKNAISTAIEAIKTVIMAIFNGIKLYFTTIFNIYKTIIMTVFNAIKAFFIRVVNGYKKIFTVGFEFIKNTVSRIANGIKNALVKPITKAKELIKAIIDKIKGFFNFKAKLPKIKLPHFSIKPKGWKFSDLLKGSIPHLGIDWYAKGGIFTSPRVIGVGDSKSPEAVIPIDKLQGMINASNAQMINALITALQAANMGGGSGSENTIVVKLGGATVATEIFKLNKQGRLIMEA